MEIKNLCKSYGKNEVYKNFNLDIREGQITCILGESGSGKTTLLNCIAQLTDYSGDIPEIKCSYIFQQPALVPNLTVRENLSLVCKDEERINRVLTAVHLSDKSGAYPKTLSGGQAQRAAIARAFLFDSDVILMDEPFSSLDLKLKSEIAKEFAGVWKGGQKTAILVTHDIDEALMLAQRIIVINSGKIIYDRDLPSAIPRELGENGEMRTELISVLMNCLT